MGHVSSSSLFIFYLGYHNIINHYDISIGSFKLWSKLAFFENSVICLDMFCMSIYIKMLWKIYTVNVRWFKFPNLDFNVDFNFCQNRENMYGTKKITVCNKIKSSKSRTDSSLETNPKFIRNLQITIWKTVILFTLKWHIFQRITYLICPHTKRHRNTIYVTQGNGRGRFNTLPISYPHAELYIHGNRWK